jgi:beta-mannosidase
MVSRVTRVPLETDWSVRAVGGDAAPTGLRDRAVPASVPGCVTTDLLAAGLIPDPYLDGNETELAWIGLTDWCFATTFELEAIDDRDRADLVCEGLDTIATVRCNGTVVARTANMHRSHRVDLRSVAVAGRNELTVTFDAPVPAAQRLSEQLGPRPHVTRHPFNAIRKMACSYGWDWGPDLASAGIWRPIAVERWRTARLASVRPLVTVVPPGDVEPGARPARGAGTVELHIAVERAASGGGPLDVACQIADHVGSATLAAQAQSAVVTLEVPDAALWWPVGYGDQPLYTVDVTLSAGGEELDTWQRRLGFRSVTLEATPDETGTALALVVNGVDITVRGVNWIPDDCFPHRVDRARYAARLLQAVEANVNLVRVWGGGIYEADAFYDVADELGLLVWQDFLFACAAYSEDEPLRSEIEAEAREAVTRLAPHPSLAVWNGCNENLWGYEDWGWKEPLGGRTWGAGYYFGLLPAIVAELDPTRPYSAGSPWSYGANAHPNDWRHGTTHVWDVWNRRDYLGYADYRPRFVSEFGFQGPPTWSTLRRAVHDEPMSPDGPKLAVHQKAVGGQEKLARGLVAHLPPPADFDAWHWATSLNQARAIAFAIERWRSIDPPCRGMVVWQLNDCWPAVSWAAVDGDGRRKPLWYALRRVFADRLLTLQPLGKDATELVAVNDGPTAWPATVELTHQDFEGRVLGKGTARLDVPPGGRVAVRLGEELGTAGDPRREVLVAEADGLKAFRWWAEDRELDLPAAAPSVTVTERPAGWEVRVHTDVLVKDLALLADKVDPSAVVDKMLVTVQAGKSATFYVEGQGIDPDALGVATVLRSANQLVARPQALKPGHRR